MPRLGDKGAVKTAAAIVLLGLLIGGIVLWRRLGKISFVETRTPDPDQVYIHWGERGMRDGWYPITEETHTA